MTATRSEAIVWSKKQTRGYVGLCLVFVRNCFGIAAKYPSAAEAWEHARYRHKTRSTSGIPAGVPVFFSTPATRYGHVALHLGGGAFRTNYSAQGTVVTATLDDAVFSGMTMLGWTEDLNGIRVYTAPKAPAKPAGYDPKVKAYQDAQVYYPGMKRDGIDGPMNRAHKAWVKRYQRALNLWESCSPKLLPDGSYGARSDTETRQVMQANKGGAYRGVIETPHPLPGRVMCEMLGIPTHPSA